MSRKRELAELAEQAEEPQLNEEKIMTGSVSLSVYKYYIKSIGVGVCIVIGLLLLWACGATIGTNIWLGEWSNKNADHDSSDHTVVESNERTDDTMFDLGIYIMFGMLQVLAVVAISVCMAIFFMRSSKKLHAILLQTLMRLPMSFYDQTPNGQILNRCGRDIDTLDVLMPEMIRNFFNCLIETIAIVVVIVYATPWFIVAVIPIAVVYVFIQRFYVAASRQLKRIESVTRSPIYSHFQESVHGAHTIRAFGAASRFEKSSNLLVDSNHMSLLLNIISQRWIGFRLELIGAFIVFFASLFAVLAQDTIEPGLAGLSISQAMSMTAILNWIVRMLTEIEANIVCVERIKEYAEMPKEADWESSVVLPADWPSKGRISLIDFATRYREDLQLVIRNISCEIGEGEKVGIVGRTGSGKSSLTLSLLRIIEPTNGRIILDGIDIATLGLHQIRSRVTVVPQDPILFSGTLRYNLDPFSSHSDAELWSALERSQLKHTVSSWPAGLDHPVSESGSNLSYQYHFSVGQRQLVCLSRALLRKSQLLLLDEATAAVDAKTDSLVQTTLKDAFSQSTVLTIAHRLDTVMYCDRILVLDQGNVLEFDSPADLLARDSVFARMVKA